MKCRNGHESGRDKSGQCKECSRLSRLRKLERHGPEYFRNYLAGYRKRPGIREQTRTRVWRRLGLPEPTRPCPQLCEACGNPPNGRGALHLDHDHVSGKFRGWLCSECNTGVGKLGDNYDGVLRALDYLLRNG